MRDSKDTSHNNDNGKRLPVEFEPVLKYTFLGGQPREKEVLDEELWHARGVVYARVWKGTVVYVGKADGTLRARLNAHLAGIANEVRSNLNPMTREYRQWAEGKTITIYAYAPPPIELCGHTVRIHAGLEAALIAAFHPKFVRRT